MSQPRHTQQLGLKDMQLWQKHLTYRQLQEIQRQRQFQQMDQGARLQNLPRSDVTRQAMASQMPAMLHGIPVNDTANHLWLNQVTGSNQRAPLGSQMFIPGNTNCVQNRAASVHGLPNGLSSPSNHGETIQSAGFLPQQLDHSLYGDPVFSMTGSLSNQSQFQGVLNGSTNVINKAGCHQGENSSLQFTPSGYLQGDQLGFPAQRSLQNDNLVSREGFQEKCYLVNSPIQSLNSGTASESFQLTNEEADWPNYMQRKPVIQARPPSGVSNLDPTEEKLLLGTDEDANLDGSHRNCNMGAGGFPYADQVESDGYSSALTSMQSGSWSALMQEALGSSSSDTGIQEEWSGLTSQNAELSSGNHSAMLNDNGKQQSAWDNHNLQDSSSLTSRSIPLVSDAGTSPDSFTANIEQSLMKNSSKHNECLPPNASYESFRHPYEQINNNQLYQNQHQKQMQFNNDPSSIWLRQMQAQSANGVKSANLGINSQNMEGFVAQQRSTQFHNIGNQLCDRRQSPLGWNMIRTPISNTYNSLKPLFDNGNLYTQTNETDKTMSLEGNSDGNMSVVGANDVAASFGNSMVKPGGGSSKLFARDYYSSNFEPVMKSNSVKPQKEMRGEVINREEFNCGSLVPLDSSTVYGEKNYQYQSSLGQQVWNSSLNRAGKGSDASYGHESGASEKLLAGKEPPSLLSSTQKLSGHFGGRTLVPSKFQYHPMKNIEMNRETSDSQKHRLYSKISRQLVSQGSENQAQGCSGRLQFPDPISLSHILNMRKGHISGIGNTSKGAEGASSPTIPASTVSAAVDGSANIHTHEKRSSLVSQNMRELHHKAELSGDNAAACLSCIDSQTPSEITESAPLTDATANFQRSLSSASQVSVPDSGHADFEVRSACGLSRDEYQYGAPSISQQIYNEATRSMPFSASSIPHVNNQPPNSIEPTVETLAEDHSLKGHPGDNAGVGSQFISHMKVNQQLMNTSHPGSSFQHCHFSQAYATSGTSQNGGPAGFSKVPHNLWTTVSDQQHLSGVLRQSIISKLPRPPNALYGSREMNPVGQKLAALPRDQEGLSAPSTDQQHIILGEDGAKENSQQQLPSMGLHSSPSVGSLSEGMEPVPTHGNAGASISSVFHLHQEGLGSIKSEQAPSQDSQVQQHSIPNVASASHETGADGQTKAVSNIQKRNYSLLQQLQAMNGATSEFTGQIAKRLKGSSVDADVPQIDWRTGQRCMYGQINMSGQFNERDSGVPLQRNSYGGQMLSFTSRSSEEKGHASLQLGDRVLPSQHIRSNELAINDKLGSSVWSQSAHGIFTKNAMNMNDGNLVDQRDDAYQGSDLQQGPSSMPPTVYASQCQPLDVVVHKQRKNATLEPLPWCKESTRGFSRLCSISMSEMDWAKAANRLIEKVEDEVAMIEDGQSIPRLRRRLILTTQLMQQIFPSLPAKILGSETLSSYEDVVNFVAKLALGDSCSLISCLGSDSSVHLDSSNMMGQRLKNFETAGDQFFSKVVEDFISRSRKLEINLSRLEKRISLSEVKMECQDLERCSIINRFAKFHGRPQAEAVECSSTIHALQRQVTALHIPSKLPKDVQCLTL